MRISDWSSDVCSSDLTHWQRAAFNLLKEAYVKARYTTYKIGADQLQWLGEQAQELARVTEIVCCEHIAALERRVAESGAQHSNSKRAPVRSEEHTSELQSLMCSSYDVLCLKKNRYTHNLIVH